MGFTERKTNFRVEVTPRQAGDFGWASISGIERTAKEEEKLCEEIARDIRRHVDNLGRHSVNVIHDTEKFCEHCGYGWTEDSKEYNGGCCDEDEKHNPAALKEKP